jgi:hypothetical protein
MIIDLNLLLVLRYVEALTSPNSSRESREDLSYQFAYTQGVDAIGGDTINLALDSYLRLDPDNPQIESNDLRDLPLHVHLWFIEQIASRRDNNVTTQLVELYQILDMPLVRHSIIEAIITQRGSLEELLGFDIGQIDILEYAEILLDLREYNQLRQLINQRNNDARLRDFISERRVYISGDGAEDLLELLDNNQ